MHPDQLPAKNMVESDLFKEIWKATEDGIINALCVRRTPAQAGGAGQAEYDAQVLQLVNELNALKAVKSRLLRIANDTDAKLVKQSKGQTDGEH